MEQLTSQRPTTWEQVLTDWRSREANRWGWEKIWRERGFASWDAWRATYFESLHLMERSWAEYRVADPEVFIPKMWAVAYSGWKRYYPPGAVKARLADIAGHPELPANGKVMSLLKTFPNPTTIIGIRCRDELALFEGMHRAATIALAARRGEMVVVELRLVLTEFRSDEAGLFEKVITQQE
ncbi:hypothetical protein EPN90_04435 [Patescibacteria group bacterium]|nr:MAG: hypothetical protein EPN90_04435 [Patescibacteria group bacterium]